MDMHTIVKVSSFAKKLRDRVKALQEQREKDLKKYAADAEAWRKELHKWIDREAFEKIKAITVAELRTNQRYPGTTFFNAQKFFSGAPLPPVYPRNEQIRRIQNMLRQLSIRGPATITVSTEEVEKLLSDKEEDYE
jgi:hypothetical protein